MPSKPKIYQKICETCMQPFETRYNIHTECPECKEFDGRLIEVPTEKVCINCQQPFTSVTTYCYTSKDEPPVVTHGRNTCPTCRKWLLELQKLKAPEELGIESHSFGYK